jgi:hypothetical protein
MACLPLLLASLLCAQFISHCCGDWVQNTDAPWTPRHSSAHVQTDFTNLLLFGGLSAGDMIHSDVWSYAASTLNWEKITTLPSWSAKFGHSVLALSQPGGVNFYMFAGASSLANNMMTVTNDVWRSSSLKSN